MPETLPASGWTRRSDLAGLVAALGPGNARYVGGAVRDTLLGEPVKDIDIATPLEPVAVIERLDAARIRSVPTGLKHGTVTAILPGGNVEITTLRRDVATDGRHAEVAFSRDWKDDAARIRSVPTGLKHGTVTAILPAGNVEITTLRRDVATDGRHAEVAFSRDWKDDAARRDFTINALYADPHSLEIFDWFGGLNDLRQRCVRFIGDARQRIREDHLRILRYFRFQARFGSEPADEEAERACAELAPTLKGLSRERVGWELQNLLALPDPEPTVARMAELGVLTVILPEADPAALEALIAVEKEQGVAPDPIRRLAALLPADPAVAEQVAARLRLSVAQKKRLAVAARRERGEPRALAYRLGREEAIDALLLTGRPVADLDEWDIPTFPLKGGAIVARGVAAGPEVARILQAVEARWIAEGFPGEDRVAELLDQQLVE